jgi:hypothetical protein
MWSPKRACQEHKCVPKEQEEDNTRTGFTIFQGEEVTKQHLQDRAHWGSIITEAAWE